MALIKRKKSNNIFLISFLKALDAKLCSDRLMEELGRAANSEQVEALLDKTLFTELIKKDSEDFFEGGRFVTSSLSWVFSIVAEYVEDVFILPFLKSQYDCLNYLILLKEKLLEQKFSSLSSLGHYSIDQTELIFGEEKFSSLPVHFKEAVKTAIEDYYEHKKPFLIDLAFEKALFRYRLELIALMRSSEIEKYQRREIDLKNCITAMRLKKQGIDEELLSMFFIDGGTMSSHEFLDICHGNKKGSEKVKAIFEIEEFDEDRGITEYESRSIKILQRMLGALDTYIFGCEPVILFVKKFESQSRQISWIFQRLSLQKISNKTGEHFRRDR